MYYLISFLRYHFKSKRVARFTRKRMSQIIRVTFPIAVGFVFEGMLDVGMEQITGWSAIAAYFAAGFVALFGFVKLRVYKWAEKEQEGEDVEDEADEDRQGLGEALVSNFH